MRDIENCVIDIVALTFTGNKQLQNNEHWNSQATTEILHRSSSR